ncbi:MAG: asparagine synthase (glutamine-hydrolyzing) [Candidatus Hydrogenedentes bacterium]|nr:asparagine synthase (glutamine-hydrolyzing) [Candidatus Hydrogenedentota bacterium]
MCGICGIMHGDREKLADIALVERMNRALEHRGPDDSGVWSKGHAALAMRRLSVIDLFRGRQPMSNQDQSVVLVYNGEIYNFQELRDFLETRGHVFHTLSDTEVVLRAYEEFGDDALHHLNGMFAFALYDARKDRLLLARDRIGIKPLFYTVRENTLAFSSELNSLLQSGLVRGALNPAAVNAYFSFLYIPSPDTIFRDVYKLPPGHKLVFEKGEVSVERYWKLELRPNPRLTVPQAAEAFMDLLCDAVRMQCISDVPLGAFLSGGIDSSSVVAMMHVNSAAPVKTFTIGFDDAHLDELKYARVAAQHFETEHTEAILKPDMVETAPYLIRFFGEPFADSSALPMWLVAQVARREVTVALSGDGGDELFAGYTWLHMTRYVNIYRRIPAILRYAVDTALRVAPQSPLVGKLRRFSHDSFLESDAVFRRRETCFDSTQRASLYGPELAALVASDAVDRFQEHVDSAGGMSVEDRMLHHDFNMYLPDDILAKVDRMTMAHALEARVPMLDNRIVDFAATVPFGMKLRGSISKYIVKRAVGSIMPPDLLKQRKQGFGIPIHRWMREDLRGHFLEIVLGHEARNTVLLNRRAVRAMFDQHIQGNDHYGHHLWALLMFEHWLRYAEQQPGITLSM